MRKTLTLLALAGALVLAGCATGQAGSAPAEFDDTTNAVFLFSGPDAKVVFNLKGLPPDVAAALFGESFNANQDFTVQPSSEGATASPTNDVEGSASVPVQ